MGMRRKTINGILTKKFNNFANSIEDKEVQDLVRKNSIISGGAIASMLLGERANDFDIYFRDANIAVRVAHYYVDKFNKAKRLQHGTGGLIDIKVEDVLKADQKRRVSINIKSAGVASETSNNSYQFFETDPDPEGQAAMEYVEAANQAVEEMEDEDKPKYRPVFLSTNAITLSQDIQLVLRFYGSPDEIHENYDFAHCTNYWTSWDKNLVLRPNALEALLAKELVYVGSKYPLCSIIRTRKFIQRGFKINAGQYLKMCMNLNALDLNDISVLGDQLTGVDVAYFFEVIEKLKEKDQTRVDGAYLLEIIDRMF